MSALRAAALFVAALASAGCADETIVLATIPVTDSGAPAPTSRPCYDSSTCLSGEYCELPECNPPPGVAGTCASLPEVCDEPEMVECGCDKVTYWSDCLRRKNGVASFTKEACLFSNTTPCGENVPNGVPCDGGALCAQLGGSMHGGSQGACDHPFPGTCWVIPDLCPGAPATDLNLWDSCSPTGPKCQDTCNAIRAGGSFRQSSLQCQ
jgi:hypothetical protein